MSVDAIPEEERRNNVGEVLRRVEAGERLTVTVAGRPVAELHPTGARRRWIGGAILDRVWRGPTPQGLDADLGLFGGALVDPFEAVDS